MEEIGMEGLSLIDARAALATVMDDLSHRTRNPLEETPGGRVPGVYALFAKLDRHPVYGGTAVGRGERPIYVGRARSVGERLLAHVKTLAQAQDLDVASFVVSVSPTPTFSEAALAEDLLLSSVVTGLWNRSWLAGFGSRTQGAARVAGQTRSPWGSLHPGRVWDQAQQARDRHALAQAARSQALADSELPSLWAPLT
jgi:hypothetical protein